MPLELTESLKLTLSSYSLETPDIESCGFVLNDGSFRPADNIADTFSPSELADMDLETLDGEDPRSYHFVMDSASQDYFTAHRDDIAAVYHNHCRADSAGYLSANDIHNSRATGIPYLLYHCHPDIDSWDYFDPKALHPYPLKDKRKFKPSQLEYYLGWPYSHPRCDCLTIFRSFFKGMLDIDVRDYPRPVNSLDYFRGHWDAYDENLGQEGFRKVSGKLRKYDLLLMKLRGRMPHHVAIVIDPVKNICLHVLEPGSTSQLFVYGGSEMIKQTHSIWRHERFI